MRSPNSLGVILKKDTIVYIILILVSLILAPSFIESFLLTLVKSSFSSWIMPMLGSTKRNLGTPLTNLSAQRQIAIL